MSDGTSLADPVEVDESDPATGVLLRDAPLRALAAESTDVILVIDAQGVITYAGPSLDMVFGHRSDEIVGRCWVDLVHPEDGGSGRGAASPAAAVRSAPETTSWNFRFRHRDGSWRWVAARFRDLSDHPAVSGIVASVRDVTDRHLVDEAARAAASLYRSIVEMAEECITIHDVAGRITFANPKMAELIGTTVAELEGQSIFDLVVGDELEITASSLERRHPGEREQYEFSLLRRDGSTCPVLISAIPLRDPAGEVTGILSMMSDISDRKQAESQCAWLALHDPLTGLANRSLVVDRMLQILRTQVRQPRLAAVLFMDLDNFKHINETVGHSAGDEVLREVARRLTAVVRNEDTVGRYGGDEFVVLLDHLDDTDNAVATAERILEAVGPAVDTHAGVVLPRLSIGIACTPAPDSDTLLHNADIAMYRAKERGGGCFELFDDELGTQVQERRWLESDLRAAVRNNEIRPHYQPVVDLNGRVTGFEALARWTHAERGSVSPGVFIPMAESIGVIEQLGASILHQACADLARWQASTGRTDLTMAVNLSGRQLADGSAVGLVMAAVRDHHLSPSSLCLEITESVLMDDETLATAALAEIHDFGVHLAVDDFGTGYSSLLYLRRFPVDSLKLDRSFVAGVDQNAQDSTIVRSVIDLAHSFGLIAVAEGVETAGQLESLREMGCDLAQGFLWSPAVPADQAEAML